MFFTVKQLFDMAVNFFHILTENFYRLLYRQTETHPVDTPRYI